MEKYAEFLIRKKRQLSLEQPPIIQGRLTRMVGLTLEAIGCTARVG